MILEQLKPEWYEFIRNLRNEEKQAFLQQTEIDETTHLKFMDRHKDNFFVATVDGKPAGYVGVVDDDIRLAVSSEFRRKGIGIFLLKEIIKKYPEARARVKVKNEPIFKLCLKCGLKQICTMTDLETGEWLTLLERC